MASAYPISGSALTPALMNANTNIDFLRGTLDPRLIQTAPPNLFNDTTFSKQVDYQLQHEVVEVDAETKAGTGMILWLVNRGLSSIYHMAFTPKNTEDQWNAATGLRPPGGYVLGWAVAAGNSSVGDQRVVTTAIIQSIVYDAPIAIPYDVLTKAQITVAPDFEETFSKTRLYSGTTEVYSDTLASGTFELNGMLAAGSVSDTRDICQTETAGQFKAYDQSDLVQSSVTQKDGLRDVSVKDGLITLVGPDIPSAFTQPNQDRVDWLQGAYQKYAINTFLNSFNFPMNPDVFSYGKQIAFMTGWVSPWISHVTTIEDLGLPPGVLSTETNGTNSAFMNTINVGAINECGVLDIDLHFDWATINQGGMAGQLGFIEVKAQHIFTTVINNGDLGYFVQDEYIQQTIDTITNSTGISVNPVPPPDFLAAPDNIFAGWRHLKMCLRPQMARESFIDNTRGGKYIGTVWMAVFTGGQIMTGNPVSAVTQLRVNDSFTVQIKDPYVNVRARNVNKLGELGPARILRYDKLSTKQVITVKGMANVQAIPQGVLAPYVQMSAMYNPESVNVNVLPWLSALYNGPTPLRRNWTRPDYTEQVKRVLAAPTIQDILDLGDGSVKVQSGSQAAGIFADLGGALGGMFGPVGSFAGSLLGGGADAIFGSRAGGEFGSGAGGEFGSRSGQGALGSYAAGEFGSRASGSRAGTLRRGRQ